MSRFTTPSKFLFSTDFAAPEAPAAELPQEPVVPMMPVAQHEALLAAAIADARSKGRAEGMEEARAGEERRLADEAARLVSVAQQVFDEIDGFREEIERDAISLAFLVARRLCAHLIARSPLGEIVALVSECLGPLREAPHLVIRVAVKDVDALKKRMDPLIEEKGFEGRLVILGEPEVERGDCRIEWADGGILRDRKAIEKQIDQIIRGYFQAKAAARARPQARETAATGETEA
ncbi:FliH/SctL family protein [Pannonibacter sp. Q-1]|uniref:Flagellar assembly protein FliH n=1 Tax=Pannonibacter phragmitetus TaxID=121719 RepID=A0A0L0IT99_9HYPH|nr:FliH/SctL family protein [Pannonibacter phragmitetus]ALV27908.1 flagellar assembly protein FliH [Pannonibacter phragmitetus]KND16672.1 flagellar assembly protein FliH [Pannonibacter phragmitetus]